MKELTFISGHLPFKFQIRDDKSIFGWNYDLKAWVPQTQIKIDIKIEKKWIKEHNFSEVVEDIIKEMAKGGAKLVREEQKDGHL